MKRLLPRPHRGIHRRMAGSMFLTGRAADRPKQEKPNSVAQIDPVGVSQRVGRERIALCMVDVRHSCFLPTRCQSTSKPLALCSFPISEQNCTGAMPLTYNARQSQGTYKYSLGASVSPAQQSPKGVTLRHRYSIDSSLITPSPTAYHNYLPSLHISPEQI